MESAEIIPIQAQDIFQSEDPSLKAVRRKVATAIGEQAEKEIFADSIGQNIPYIRYLAIMLWDLVVDGKLTFADGTSFKVEKLDQWIDTVKFLSNHLDGPARDTNVGVNFYKVYVGIDESKV